MDTPLTSSQVRHLRSLAHELKPIVTMGAKGISTALLTELDRALSHHQLIKIKIQAEDRAARDQVIEQLLRETGARLVQRIGHVACLYRPNPERTPISLPG